MALIEKNGSLITISDLTKAAPLSTFFIRLEPLSRVSENVTPYNTNIFYDSREINFHIFNSKDKTDYQHLYFSQFTDTIDPEIMYYGTLQYAQYSGLFYVYDKVRVPGNKITWVKSSGIWHGTIDERYRSYGEEGYSEFYQYIDSSSALEEANDYSFTVDGIDIYVKDTEHNGDSEEAWLNHLKYCTFCYAINPIHHVSKLEELHVPVSGTILVRPYPCFITYESSESAQTRIMNSKQVWPDDIDNIAIKTITNSPLARLDGALPMPPKNLIITLPVVQEGTGTPSPDNPRPFKFYDKIHIEYQGIGSNIFDYKNYYNNLNNYIQLDEDGVTTIHPYQVTLNDDGSVTATGKTFRENPWKVPSAYIGYKVRLKGRLTAGGAQYCNNATIKQHEENPEVPEWLYCPGVIVNNNTEMYDNFEVDENTYIRITNNNYNNETEDTVITIDSLQLTIETGGETSNSCDVQLPQNTFFGKVDLVEGTILRQSYDLSASISIDDITSNFYNTFSYLLIDTNNCPIVSVTKTEPTDGDKSQTLYVAELEFPPDVPTDFYTNVNVKNNQWLCSHYDIGTGGTGVFTVNENTHHLQIFDTRFDTLEHALKYLHNPQEPIYFIIKRLFWSYYDSAYEDTDYFYSPLTEINLNSNTILKMDYNYNLSYYTNTATQVAALESRIVALEKQEESNT